MNQWTPQYVGHGGDTLCCSLLVIRLDIPELLDVIFYENVGPIKS